MPENNMNVSDPVHTNQGSNGGLRQWTECTPSKTSTMYERNASIFHPWRLSHGLLLKPFNCPRLEWAPQYTSVASRTVTDIRKTRRAAIMKICLLQGRHPGERRADSGGSSDELERRLEPLQGESIWALQYTVNLGPLSPLSVPRDRVKMSTEVSYYGWPSRELGWREEPPKPIHNTELLRNSCRVHKKLLEAEPVWIMNTLFHYKQE